MRGANGMLDFTTHCEGARSATLKTGLVKKAVVPVAGLGTRMLPASKAIPKEMLPLADTPIIQHVVQECVAAGIREIVLVTHSSKNSIENHFDRSFELESALERRVKRQILSEMQSICPPGVTIMHVRQGEPKGLAHAISCAYPLVGHNPFAVVLPDIVINESECSLESDNLAELIAGYDRDEVSRLLIDPVRPEDVQKYGVIASDAAVDGAVDLLPVTGIVEKPTLETAPSNLSLVGRYVLSEKIWPYFAKTPLGYGGEIQLSDALDLFLRDHPVYAVRMKGGAFDCGDKLGYMKAFVHYSLRHPAVGLEFGSFLKTLIKAM